MGLTAPDSASACCTRSGGFRPGGSRPTATSPTAAGAPRAARAVGNIMKGCRVAGVPCHRVVAAGGRLGGYGGSEGLKRALLQAEGHHGFGRPRSANSIENASFFVGKRVFRATRRDHGDV